MRLASLNLCASASAVYHPLSRQTQRMKLGRATPDNNGHNMTSTNRGTPRCHTPTSHVEESRDDPAPRLVTPLPPRIPLHAAPGNGPRLYTPRGGLPPAWACATLASESTMLTLARLPTSSTSHLGTLPFGSTSPSKRIFVRSGSSATGVNCQSVSLMPLTRSARRGAFGCSVGTQWVRKPWPRRA